MFFHTPCCLLYALRTLERPDEGAVPWIDEQCPSSNVVDSGESEGLWSRDCRGALAYFVTVKFCPSYLYNSSPFHVFYFDSSRHSNWCWLWAHAIILWNSDYKCFKISFTEFQKLILFVSTGIARWLHMLRLWYLLSCVPAVLTKAGYHFSRICTCVCPVSVSLYVRPHNKLKTTDQ